MRIRNIGEGGRVRQGLDPSMDSVRIFRELYGLDWVGWLWPRF